MDDKYSTTLRLYKNNPVHFQALTCLETYNRELFSSKNDFIAEAVIYYAEHLKKKAEYEELEDTISSIREHEEFFQELTKRALEKALHDMQAISTPVLSENMTKTEEKQEPEKKNEQPDIDPATEKDFKLLEFYGSFGDFEDEGEDCL